jgi:hypothetical protein
VLFAGLASNWLWSPARIQLSRRDASDYAQQPLSTH